MQVGVVARQGLGSGLDLTQGHVEVAHVDIGRGAQAFQLSQALLDAVQFGPQVPEGCHVAGISWRPVQGQLGDAGVGPLALGAQFRSLGLGGVGAAHGAGEGFLHRVAVLPISEEVAHAAHDIDLDLNDRKVLLAACPLGLVRAAEVVVPSIAAMGCRLGHSHAADWASHKASDDALPRGPRIGPGGAVLARADCARGQRSKGTLAGSFVNQHWNGKFRFHEVRDSADIPSEFAPRWNAAGAHGLTYDTQALSGDDIPEDLRDGWSVLILDQALAVSVWYHLRSWRWSSSSEKAGITRVALCCRDARRDRLALPLRDAAQHVDHEAPHGRRGVEGFGHADDAEVIAGQLQQVDEVLEAAGQAIEAPDDDAGRAARTHGGKDALRAGPPEVLRRAARIDDHLHGCPSLGGGIGLDGALLLIQGDAAVGLIGGADAAVQQPGLGRAHAAQCLAFLWRSITPTKYTPGVQNIGKTRCDNRKWPLTWFLSRLKGSLSGTVLQCRVHGAPSMRRCKSLAGDSKCGIASMGGMVPRKLVRVSIAVKKSGIPLTPAHVTRLIKSGTVPGRRIGGRFYTTTADVIAALGGDA